MMQMQQAFTDSIPFTIYSYTSDENKLVRITKCDAFSSSCESISYASASGCESFICCVPSTCFTQRTAFKNAINLSGMILDRVSIWKRYISGYLQWRVDVNKVLSLCSVHLNDSLTVWAVDHISVVPPCLYNCSYPPADGRATVSRPMRSNLWCWQTNLAEMGKRQFTSSLDCDLIKTTTDSDTPAEGSGHSVY